MPNTQGNNGPRAGRSTGRSRNTLVNNASKKPSGGGGVPIDPQAALSMGSQTAAAKYGLMSQLAALRQNQALVKSQYKMGLAGAVGQRRADVSAAANSAMDRGMIGSSVDMTGRADAHTTFATTQAQLQQDRLVGLLGVKQDKLDATNQYQMQMADIAANRQLQQTLAANAATLADAQSAQANDTSYQDAYAQLLQQLLHQRTGQQPRKKNGVNGAEVGTFGESVWPNTVNYYKPRI